MVYIKEFLIECIKKRYKKLFVNDINKSLVNIIICDIAAIKLFNIDRDIYTTIIKRQNPNLRSIVTITLITPSCCRNNKATRASMNNL
ncbi:hypothetical protein TSAR_012078 [Trichomalopsis sarcophagae]|uniref:Uncharacterized protein n=1 Tax=Trichomalopsis sarcophagae TaxID=543379 RepID=A0A232EUD4_9HYME|nr:hypothetical protein TSAR_012078 [Trichomalopsis sarcophagae]